MPDRGDFGVTACGGLMGRLIRWATRSSVNHAFVYITDGRVVEGDPHGARYNTADSYPNAVWSNLPLTDLQRAQISIWAVAHLGTPYSWLDDVEIGLTKLFDWSPRWMRRRLASDRTLMCSQLVAAAYEAAGIDLFPNRPNGSVTPGDLAGLIGR